MTELLDVLDNALLRLRRKSEVDPSVPRHIVTVWGKGLLLQADGP
jgi:DNA-binding response OmpR family regulator